MSLAAERDRFAETHPERAEDVSGRRWGVVETSGDGAGPALVLLPGTLGRADVFWRLMTRLAGRVHCMAVSYPAAHDLAQWGEDVLRLMDRSGVGEATVLGSSLGGYAAQWLAAARPDRLTRLIAANTLSDASAVGTRPPYSGDLAAAPIGDLRDGFFRGLDAWAEAHPDQRELTELLKADAGGRIPEAELRARLMALKHAPALPPPPLPPERMAVIECEDDPLIPEPMRAQVRAALRPARVFRFREGGHFPYVSRPDPYAAAVAAVLGLGEPEGWEAAPDGALTA